jgi:subtilase family serine protease
MLPVVERGTSLFNPTQLFPCAVGGRSMKTKFFTHLFLSLFWLVAAALPANAATGKYVVSNHPNFVSTAPNLGAEDPSKTIEVSIWLQPHNRAALDALAKDLYNSASPNYRHWINRSDFATRFAPTAAEATAVKNFFTSNNLKVVKVGPNNFFVRARGTVGDVEKAFQVQLNNYQVAGQTVRANDRDPFITGAAASLVRSVAGLNTSEFQHPMMVRSTSLPTGAPAAAAAHAKSFAAPAAPTLPPDFFTTNCFDGVKTETSGQAGTFPFATFKGNHYFETPTSAGCGYTPQEIYTAYHLNGLYAAGHDGTGQTIAIIDWCGSLTIQQDANAFSAFFGLPPITSSNFTITEVPTASTCAGPNLEINLDVEWAHAIAPGAKINLVVPPSGSFQDIDQAESYAIVNKLGNVISGSYGAPEFYVDPTELENGNLLSEIAAVFGIATNFSSDDQGDGMAYFGVLTPSYPAAAPFATAVGGVTLALKPNNTIAWQSGWGENQTLLAQNALIYDPPINFGFVGGAGGGPSSHFAKPSYQKNLGGKFRKTPDISWLADPFTGGVVLITQAGQYPPQAWFTVGGTSLACPMFSALWAIANQEAGAPLGQAAPYLYSMPAGTITDVVPVSSTNNVTDSVRESSTVTNQYNGAAVAGATGPFYSALWDYPFIQDTTVVLTFGTDSSLTTRAGWDNVTGMGTPIGKPFADHFFVPPPAKAK